MVARFLARRSEIPYYADLDLHQSWWGC